MSSINTVVLTGRLTKEPQMSAIPSTGTLVARFSLAVNDYYKQTETVSYINCVAYGRIAQVMESYTTKGSLVGVVGKLKQNRYEDSAGNKKDTIQVMVDKLQMLDSKKMKDLDDASARNYKKEDSFIENEVDIDIIDDEPDYLKDEDIPF